VLLTLAFEGQIEPRCAQPGVRALELHALHLRARDHVQVRSCDSRSQERGSSAPAPAASLVHLEIGVAKIIAPIELGNLRNAALRRGLAPGIENLPVDPALLDPQLATLAMKLIGPVLIVLGAPEHGQDVIPAPAAIAELCPVVVVLALTAHVDHRVDG
jgi:hypothetical protein